MESPTFPGRFRVQAGDGLEVEAEFVVWAALIWAHSDIGKTLGDTDDALRLVLVREVLHGRGWYDQLVTRLAPPTGVWMHWSRLLDGRRAGAWERRPSLRQ